MDQVRTGAGVAGGGAENEAYGEAGEFAPVGNVMVGAAG
ncbi:hypothetical protein OK074_2958 [Actinobacteria bacterium OK074]|nr:hypothetical protein OK074_2958 [Actinobacteria bacterium OK074]